MAAVLIPGLPTPEGNSNMVRFLYKTYNKGLVFMFLGSMGQRIHCLKVLVSGLVTLGLTLGQEGSYLFLVEFSVCCDTTVCPYQYC